MLLNDAKVAERIGAQFVPVSGSVERWQPERYGWNVTESSKWFTAMASRAYKGTPHLEKWFEVMNTYQGFYVAGADGTPYGYTNTLLYGDLTAEKFLKFLDEGVQKYKKQPPHTVNLTDQGIRRAAPATLPDSVSAVVRVLSRDRLGSEGGRPFIGRDHMWIYHDDVKELLDSGTTTGTVIPVPREFVARLVRFQLLDHIGNVGQQFGEKDVRKADFSAKIIRQEGTIRSYSFHGDYASERVGSEEEKGRKFGIEGTIDGEFDVDIATRKIGRFRAYGEATAWGHHGRDGKWPLVFAMTEANDEIARSVPPVWYGISPVWMPVYRRPTLTLWQRASPFHGSQERSRERR